jgi:hypothetical protein
MLPLFRLHPILWTRGQAFQRFVLAFVHVRNDGGTIGFGSESTALQSVLFCGSDGLATVAACLPHCWGWKTTPKTAAASPLVATPAITTTTTAALELWLISKRTKTHEMQMNDQKRNRIGDWVIVLRG